jgi:hypothetical protein
MSLRNSAAHAHMFTFFSLYTLFYIIIIKKKGTAAATSEQESKYNRIEKRID